MPTAKVTVTFSLNPEPTLAFWKANHGYARADHWRDNPDLDQVVTNIEEYRR